MDFDTQLLLVLLVLVMCQPLLIIAGIPTVPFRANNTALHSKTVLTLTDSVSAISSCYKLPIFLPSPKQLPFCTLVEMWSHFRPQSPWAQSARVQCWNSSVGRAGLGAVQSAEFLWRSTLYSCPHCEQLGSAGSALSLMLGRRNSPEELCCFLLRLLVWWLGLLLLLLHI